MFKKELFDAFLIILLTSINSFQKEGLVAASLVQKADLFVEHMQLGDPERKAASGAGYQLSCLLSAHPNMKVIFQYAAVYLLI